MFGEHDDTVEEGWEQGIEPELVVVHPDYNQHTIDNDFTADGEVSTPRVMSGVLFSNKILPSCGPTKRVKMPMVNQDGLQIR